MDITGFLNEHQLPDTYQAIAQEWFIPLADEILSHRNGAEGPFFVGVNGCQGSGKSTLCDFLIHYFTHQHGLSAVTISLDDFYLSRARRQELAANVHPLLCTRGVPGTHNTVLADSTFTALKSAGSVALPRFNKATDDPFEGSAWPVITSPPDIVLIEGWCWGVSAQSEDALKEPVNDLERTEDPDGTWRRYVNDKIAAEYESLYDEMQYWVMLKGPSFEHVYKWRCEQEHKLAAKTGKTGIGIMSDEQILRFIQHYQRLTEHAFNSLPAKCNQVFELDENRVIKNVIRK